MYVVGAGKLRSFCEKRSDAVAPLGALHALLNEGEWATPEALLSDMNAIAEALSDGTIALDFSWCGARIILRCNYSAGVVLIERITRSES